MQTFQEAMIEYQSQLQKGDIQVAYRGLMEYIAQLKTHFQKEYPDYGVSGGIYYGYMDMTYFSFSPEFLQDRKLKIAIVFLHEACRFEVWLSAVNKRVQQEYWTTIKESGWKKYRLVPTIKGADSIVECTLANNPDFGDLAALTAQIEKGTLRFVKDVEGFLSRHQR